MLILVIVLLALWLIVTIVGFAIEGLVWIAVIGFVRRSALRKRDV